MKEIALKTLAEAQSAIQPVNPPNGTPNDLETNITNIINGIIGILGVVTVVIIIIGGIQYMTSSGDASKVKKAKDTILYGVIGLIVVVLAFAIANFVIGNINKA